VRRFEFWVTGLKARAFSLFVLVLCGVQKIEDFWFQSPGRQVGPPQQLPGSQDGHERAHHKKVRGNCYPTVCYCTLLYAYVPYGMLLYSSVSSTLASDYCLRCKSLHFLCAEHFCTSLYYKQQHRLMKRGSCLSGDEGSSTLLYRTERSLCLLLNGRSTSAGTNPTHTALRRDVPGQISGVQDNRC